jgi:uncharacterized Zn-binding protein involved in type VI secretion
MVTGVVPHVGGPQVLGAPTVMIAAMPSGGITSQEVCVGPPDVDLKCSATVLIAGKPADRLADNSAHGGLLVTGAPTVMIGG